MAPPQLGLKSETRRPRLRSQSQLCEMVTLVARLEPRNKLSPSLRHKRVCRHRHRPASLIDGNLEMKRRSSLRRDVAPIGVTRPTPRGRRSIPTGAPPSFVPRNLDASDPRHPQIFSRTFEGKRCRKIGAAAALGLTKTGLLPVGGFCSSAASFDNDDNDDNSSIDAHYLVDFPSSSSSTTLLSPPSLNTLTLNSARSFTLESLTRFTPDSFTLHSASQPLLNRSSSSFQTYHPPSTFSSLDSSNLPSSTTPLTSLRQRGGPAAFFGIRWAWLMVFAAATLLPLAAAKHSTVYYMNTFNCGGSTKDVDGAVVYSDVGPAYTDYKDCHIKFKADKGLQKLKLRFEWLDLHCGDTLSIYAGMYNILSWGSNLRTFKCKDNGISTEVLANNRYMTLRYQSNPHAPGRGERRGFKAVLTAYETFGICSMSNHKCENGLCIDDDLTCDQINHCGDNSDEAPKLNCVATHPHQFGSYLKLGVGAVVGFVVLVILLVILIVSVIACCLCRSRFSPHDDRYEDSPGLGFGYGGERLFGVLQGTAPVAGGAELPKTTTTATAPPHVVTNDAGSALVSAYQPIPGASAPHPPFHAATAPHPNEAPPAYPSAAGDFDMLLPPPYSPQAIGVTVTYAVATDAAETTIGDATTMVTATAPPAAQI